MSPLSRAELEALVAEAVVDAHDDDEQLTGLYTMIADNLAVPFTTQVLGVEATVRRVDLRPGGIVAVCDPSGDRDSGPSVAGSSAGGRAVDRRVSALGGCVITYGGHRVPGPAA